VGRPLRGRGRELELPSQIVAGRLLYGDLRFHHGPLGPYVNALLYRLFGVHLDVLIGAGLVSAALMTWVLYRLARRFVDRPTATMTAG
jgi:4-amino-4-deoxy-L-arabinose transferase-like glycosyltransferase